MKSRRITAFMLSMAMIKCVNQQNSFAEAAVDMMVYSELAGWYLTHGV